ncbi:unnamed protein product [Microthlaspi erraticum]|uniref:Uncharacterized protein n=1 Tax=Microthlaspi erraticum TaxID=1685480 RepID=A0A6D2KWK2_9BRAS|nr:unnamed protein product [Microthlaspi erraticum]
MANTFLEVETGFPTSPSSATDPRLPSRWWTQSQYLLFNGKELTEEERSATFKLFVLGAVTTLAVFITVSFYTDILSCQASFSVESIFVSPSSAVWHIDLLVKNPGSTCPIYYNGDDVYAKLGSINAAVLKTSHTRRSGGYTSFSVDLATGSNQSDVVAASPRAFELDLKISAKKKRFILASSTCPISYDSDDVYAKLGSINAAVLKTSHTRRSGGYTSFSVDLATGSNQSDVVTASPRAFELDIKLGAKKKRFILGYQSGHFDVRCQNLIIGHEKIKCHSSFEEMKLCCYENEE